MTMKRQNAIAKQLKDPRFLAQLNANKELCGAVCAKTGRITYGKIVDERSYALFTDIIASLVPFNYIYNTKKRDSVPSIANVLLHDADASSCYVYPKYVYLKATMEGYEEWENEEDQIVIDDFLEAVDNNPGKSVVAICVMTMEALQSAHAVALIGWKRGNTYKVAFYDSLAYKRGKISYDYAEKAFDASRFSQRIEFIDLDAYCFAKPETTDFHCAQYVMDADYCYIYAMYFLKIWMDGGAKLHRASFRKAIKGTYVVDPAKLSRTDNRESMIYRVTLIAFASATLLAFFAHLTTQQKRIIKHSKSSVATIKKYVHTFSANYGIALI